VELLSLLDLPDMPAPVVEGLCEAVAILGLWPALPVLLDLLDRSMDDIELTLGIIRSLGLLGAEAALEPLESLLGAGAYERLRHAAGQCTLQQPAAACLVQGGLPEVLADRLAVALAGSTVSADQPTTLEEFLRREADLLRAAAACALARVGGPRAQAILRAALVDEHTRGAAAALLNALAEAHPPTGATALADVIAAANVSMAVRWLAIERLATHPDGELPMVRLLDSADLDPFVQGALAEGLGRRGAREAAPRLRALARDRQTDNHLRAQAVCGLALAGGPVAETTLLQLIDDLDEDADLRGLAAEQLPQITTPEVLRRLRGHLNDPRVPAPLAAGILHALGRARDREALPLLLQYCQGETPAVALAALRALADVGDPVVTPILVRISQTPQTDRTVRLQAVGVLIELGGDVYRALLQPYLTRSTLPVRLQALDLLIHAGAPASKLYAMLADRSLPLAMRLRLFEYCSAVSAVVPVFAQIVAETDDDIELRSLAALHLGDVRADTAEPLLAALASDETVALRLRLCCIAALGAIGGTAAGLVLSRLAEDAGQPLVLRRRALAALQRLIEEATDDA
jgi:HEAT repeat protein